MIGLTLSLVLGQIPTLETPEYSRKLQEQAVCATVRVLNSVNDVHGSGVVVGRSGPSIYILTAAHVVEGADNVEIQSFTAASYPKPAFTFKEARVVGLGDKLTVDLAIVRVLTTESLTSISVCPKDALPRKKTFAALAVGCGAAKPTCVLDVVLGSKSVRRPGSSSVSLCWEGKAKSEPGRSGGPLVSSRGFLIGICSGTSGAHGYYCHITEIHRFLTRQGLDWLFEKAKKSGAES
jgi:S1-C subfamily serine protease